MTEGSVTEVHRWITPVATLLAACTSYAGHNAPRDGGQRADGVAPSQVGGPCRDDEDCAEGTCLARAGMLEFPDGYCTRGCGVAGTRCGAEQSVCVFINLQRPSILNCLSRCEGKCRPGYLCTQLFGDRVCLPEVAVDLGPAPPPVDTCAVARVDLDLVGERLGDVTRYRGDTTAAPERGNVPSPCGVGGDRRQVAMRYTPRRARRLRARIDPATVDAGFQPTLWAQDICAPVTDAPQFLGCAAPDAWWVSRAAIRGAAPVYFFVGGAETAPREGGRFELVVEEVDDLAAGAPCDPASDLCALGSSCRGVPGARRCIADGAAAGACRDAACDEGLVCVDGACIASLPAGSRCGAGVVSSCAAGTTCAGPPGMERCTAEGAAGGVCRVAPGAPCDAGLSCVDIPAGRHCLTPLASGAPCDTGAATTCAPDATCEGDVGARTCTLRGTPGGRCRPEGMGAVACDSPAQCVGAACVRAIGAGAACDPAARGEACVAGTFCAPRGAGTACQQTGVAGTPCFPAGGPRCEGGLVCSNPAGPGVCRSPGSADGPCDLTFNSVACPAGTACAASSHVAAACRRTSAETEPNDTPSGAQGPVVGTAAFSGRLDAGDPADCFAATTSTGGSLVVETSTPEAPDCASLDTAVTLYDAAGAIVATSDDDLARRGRCSYLVARGLAAGRHAVCVRRSGAAGASAAYDLSIGVFTP